MTSRPSPTPPSSDTWSQATWEGARVATLLEGARMTLAEKLAWLEETTRALAHLHSRALERLKGTRQDRSTPLP